MYEENIDWCKKYCIVDFIIRVNIFWYFLGLLYGIGLVDDVFFLRYDVDVIVIFLVNNSELKYIM